MQFIRLHMTVEDDETDSIQTLVIATVDTEGYIELTSFIENELIVVDSLYDIAEFIEDNLDPDRRNASCH